MPPRIRRPAALALVTASLVALSGCAADAPAAGGPGSASASADPVRLALVRQLGAGDYYEQWLAGAQAQAEELGAELQVFDANGDNAQQALQVQQATAADPGALIVDHGFTDSLKAPVAAALEADVPVVAFDVDTGNDGVVAVTQSDAKLAEAVTGRLVADTGGTAEVIYAYVAGFAPLDRRDAVWKDVQADEPGLEQVAQIGVVNESTAAQTADQAKAALQANPDVTAIFAPYDEFAKGAVQAVRELGLADTVKVYGADVSNADIEAITAEGSPWVATAATDPSNVGRVTVRAAYLAATGGDVDDAIEVPPALLTQADLRDRGITTVPELVEAFPDLSTPDIAAVG